MTRTFSNICKKCGKLLFSLFYRVKMSAGDRFNMIYVIEFVFYSIFSIFWLYSLVDKFYILNSNGAKLDKYVNNDLQNITGNFEEQNKTFFLKYFFNKNFVYQILSPNKIYVTFSIYFIILLVKLAFTYPFIKTNFLPFQFFSKTLDLASLLGNNFILFKVLYYFFFSIVTIRIVYQIVNWYFEKRSLSCIPKEMNSEIFIKVGLDEAKNEIIIKEKGLYQNVLITGSIGSGKTSSAISNFTKEFMKYQLNGLIIDVKGNYINEILNMKNKFCLENTIYKISIDSDFKYNPLDKPYVSANELANRMRKVLELLSDMSHSDSYWVDKVENFLRDFIVLIRANDKIVSFYEIHRLVTEKEYLLETIAELKEKILNGKFGEDDLFNLRSAISNIKNEFLMLDDRTVGIIKSEITRITSVFVSDKKLYDCFCQKSDELNFYNHIYVVSINIGENQAISKIICTYLKLDFQKQVLSTSFNRKNVFFICDEYQEIANIEDGHFFSLSREYQCINIISMQSYSSLIEKLRNEYAAKIIIQNLVNKIWFRNDDTYTISEVIKQIGKETMRYQTTNVTESPKFTHFNIFSNKFKSYHSSLSKSYSFSEKKEYIIDENYFSYQLNTFQAVCLISDGMEIKLYKKCYLKRWE